MSPEPDPTAPHLSPASWGELIDSLDAATIFVVVGGWLGADARASVSVEDIWQETLWMAWRDRHQHEWSGVSRYRSWLLGIARHRVLDTLRALGRHKRGGPAATARFSDLGGPDTVGGMLPARSTTPSRLASHVERARTLERALQSLDPELRDVVRLRLFEEVPMTEVAERLSLPLSTAKHRLMRGLQAYRRELERRGGPGASIGPS